MVGVIIATHGKLAEELVHTAEGICGKMPGCVALCIDGSASIEACRQRLADAIKKVDSGDGVLILTDMFGGTPANLALTFLNDRLEVLTGVNLPMLLKVATSRDEGNSLAATAALLTSYGQKNITLASELLRARARSPRN